MSKIIILSIVILLAISFISWLLYIFVFKGKKIISLYKKLDTRYNFTSDIRSKSSMNPYPESKGEYRKRKVIIGTFDKPNGGKPSPHTYIKLGSSSNTDFSFILQKRSRKNKFIHSREEVISGDEEFDRTFVIQSNDHDLMRKILDYTNSNKLIQASKIGYRGEMILLGGEMMYNEPGVISSDNDLMRIELLLHGMCDLCDDIESYTVVKI